MAVVRVLGSAHMVRRAAVVSGMLRITSTAHWIKNRSAADTKNVSLLLGTH